MQRVQQAQISLNQFIMKCLSEQLAFLAQRAGIIKENSQRVSQCNYNYMTSRYRKVLMSHTLHVHTSYIYYL